MRAGSGRTIAWLVAAACLLVPATFLVSKQVAAAQATEAAKSAHAELVRQQALARNEGIPLTVAEFSPNPPTPDAENAAPLYREAAKLLKEVSKKNRAWQKFDLSHLDRPETLAADRACIADAEPALAIAGKAAKRPKCDLRRQYRVEAFDPMENAEFKFVAKVLICKARLEVHDDHPLQALGTLTAFAPISGHLAQSPGTIEALVHTAVDQLFTSTIADILRRAGGEAGVAAAAMSALNTLGPMPALAPMVEAENLQSLDALGSKYLEPPASQAATLDEGDKDTKRILALAKHPGMPDRWRALQIQSTREFVALFKTAGDDWLGLEAKSDELQADLSKPNDDVHTWRILVNNLDWSGVLDVMALQVSRRRVLTQAAAVLEAHSRSGEFPKELPITGEAARDPLAKGPLHYKLTANGFTIYGVGPHGVDHGGTPRSPSFPPGHYDIVFTYHEPLATSH